MSYKRAAPNLPPGAPAQNTTGTFWGLQGSASVNGKTLTLTVVNPHATEISETEIAVRGAKMLAGQAMTLTANDIHAHNSFDNPKALTPANGLVQISNGSLVYRFPAASVTRLTLTLA